VYSVTDVRQIEWHAAELSAPYTSPFGAEIAVAKLKKYILPDNNEIPIKLD
jgi:hypothetical protein